MAKAATKPKETTPITWQLIKIDKALIRPNPNNPKLRDEKGFHQLDVLMKKFGVIYDGIVNADYS